MSGDTGALFQELVAAIKIRTAEINEDPATKYEYQLLFEDSKFDPKTTHLAATKLLFTDKVDVLAPTSSLSAKITMPLVRRAKVPQVSLSYEDCADGESCFSYFLTSGDVSELSCATAAALGLKSCVVVACKQDGAVRADKELRKHAQAWGLNYKEIFWFNALDSKDYRAHLLRARELNPDFYHFWAFPPAIDILFKQARELGGIENITTVETFDEVENKAFIEGLWIAGCPPLRESFIAKMKEKGVLPTLVYTPYAYDLPAIIAEAFERAGDGQAKPTGEAVCAALRGMKTIHTQMGEVHQDAHGAFHPRAALIYYENGVGREVSLEELKRLKGVK